MTLTLACLKGDRETRYSGKWEREEEETRETDRHEERVTFI